MTIITETTYEQIKIGKIKTMKNIFIELGTIFAPYAEALTDDELVNSFDFFNNITEAEDSEAADEGIWYDYFTAIVHENFLSRETLRKLQKNGAFVPD